MDHSLPTSWMLIGRAVLGDDPARSDFVRRYDSFVRRVLARRWRNTRFAQSFDDAVQDVFVECFKPKGVLAKADAKRGSFRGLLFQVTSNVAARFERSANRTALSGDHEAMLEELTSAEQSVFVQLSRDEAAELVRLALQKMLTSDDPDLRRRAQLLDRHTGQGDKIITIAAGDPSIAESLHREHSKAKKEWKQFLREVIQAEYSLPANEAEEVMVELLDAFRDGS